MSVKDDIREEVVIPTLKTISLIGFPGMAIALAGCSGKLYNEEALTNSDYYSEHGWDVSATGNLETKSSITTGDIVGQVTRSIRGFSTMIFGVAIIAFVLRIVLTAIDRFVFAQSGSYFHVPFAYPNPQDGRWANDSERLGDDARISWTWKRIFLNFAKNVAIASAAWLLANVTIGIVQLFFTGGKKPADVVAAQPRQMGLMEELGSRVEAGVSDIVDFFTGGGQQQTQPTPPGQQPTQPTPPAQN